MKYHNPIHAASKPTYIRSKNRLDYILVSRDLLPAITAAGHYDFHELIQTSDHRGIYLSLDTLKLFDSNEVDPTHIAHRRLQLHRRNSVEKYLEYLTQMLDSRKFWQRTLVIIKKIQQTNGPVPLHLVDQFDKLDRERTQYMLAAEKKAGIAPKQGIYEWSPRLEKAGRIFTYWKARLHFRKLNLPTPQSLINTLQNLQVESKFHILSLYKSKT